MDTTQLIRDPKVVRDALTDPSTGKCLAKRPLKIHILKRFTENQLAFIGQQVLTLAVFAIIVDDSHYTVFNLPTMVEMQPDSIVNVKVNDIEYLELSFEKGSAVLTNSRVVQRNTLPYYEHNDFITKGKGAWFMNADDFAKLFTYSRKYAGRPRGANRAVMEMITSFILRNPADLTKFFRMIPKAPVTNFSLVRFESVSYGTSNTLTKVAGSYSEEGEVSALVNPSERLEPIEQYIRV